MLCELFFLLQIPFDSSGKLVWFRAVGMVARNIHPFPYRLFIRFQPNYFIAKGNNIFLVCPAATKKYRFVDRFFGNII